MEKPSKKEDVNRPESILLKDLIKEGPVIVGAEAGGDTEVRAKFRVQEYSKLIFNDLGNEDRAFLVTEDGHRYILNFDDSKILMGPASDESRQEVVLPVEGENKFLEVGERFYLRQGSSGSEAATSPISRIIVCKDYMKARSEQATPDEVFTYTSDSMPDSAIKSTPRDYT